MPGNCLGVLVVLLGGGAALLPRPFLRDAEVLAQDEGGRLHEDRLPTSYISRECATAATMLATRGHDLST